MTLLCDSGCHLRYDNCLKAASGMHHCGYAIDVEVCTLSRTTSLECQKVLDTLFIGDNVAEAAESGK